MGLAGQQPSSARMHRRISCVCIGMVRNLELCKRLCWAWFYFYYTGLDWMVCPPFVVSDRWTFATAAHEHDDGARARHVSPMECSQQRSVVTLNRCTFITGCHLKCKWNVDFLRPLDREEAQIFFVEFVMLSQFQVNSFQLSYWFMFIPLGKRDQATREEVKEMCKKSLKAIKGVTWHHLTSGKVKMYDKFHP